MTRNLERGRPTRDDKTGPAQVDAPAAESDEEEPLPPLSEQMSAQLGGWRGLVEASIPVLVFVITNVILGLVFDDDATFGAIGTKPALKLAVIAAVVVALAMAAWRLSQRQSIRHAMNGLFGIALGAILAWNSGEARDFYLPGLFIGMGYGVALLSSVFFKQPLVGWVWSVVADGGRKDWRDDPRLVRTFAWLTVLWAATYFVKTGVQVVLYAQDMPTALGIARIAFGYPPYLLLVALTVWAVRRVRTPAP
ncbi:hypothetical protein F4553_005840 [Allocatelliglobosispora scoriae]|uniref:DUF3159 domain-containing protein n=2 Tax=Allocatelliglobosispora scoriae TaxID=643052 RepID=A0A841BXZ2_9ACTN|nr:hypothetical protein [Allocatelliglobosispora scoriae]